jgi:hypothetical protein
LNSDTFGLAKDEIKNGCEETQKSPKPLTLASLNKPLTSLAPDGPSLNSNTWFKGNKIFRQNHTKTEILVKRLFSEIGIIFLDKKDERGNVYQSQRG